MTVPCTHWKPDFTCTIGAFAGTISPGTCVFACDKYHGPALTHSEKERIVGMTISAPRQRRGLGDFIAFIIKLLTIGLVKMCPYCNSRRVKINGWWFSFIDRFKRILTRVWHHDRAERTTSMN